MPTLFTRARGAVLAWIAAFTLLVSLPAQTPAAPEDGPMPYDPDSAALVLARRYLAGGPDARAALVEALGRMGWGVRDLKGAVVHAAPAGADTGLAMRDYELEELLWKPAEQPAIRFISYAQAIAVPMGDADPEELVQDLLETVRRSANSAQPQQRFWGRFVVALGLASPEGYDLLAAPPPTTMQPTKADAKAIEAQVRKNPMAAMALLQPKPVWPDDDPVLAPSPRPERTEDDPRKSTLERDQERMDALNTELGQLSGALASSDPAKQKAAQEKMARLSTEMAAISQRQMAANARQASRALKRVAGEQSDDEDDGPRFLAEWREQPLSLLQVALLTRVFTADLRLAAFRGAKLPGYTDAPGAPRARAALPVLPVAMLGHAQAGGAPTGGPPTDFGGQFSGAIGDIWATAWGAYTGELIEHYLPNRDLPGEPNKFSKAVAVANTIIAWFKTIMTVARQNITVEVENAPLVRTKTRSPGEQRTATAKVVIDFPKSDALKALRAAANLTTVDLQMPDGGPVGGAKVVWRLTEGSYNNKYQTAKGGWEYHPEFAVVQFAQAGGPAAYRSFTDGDGVAKITIEGAPQRRLLPPTVRPYPRRAAITVEVTIKVGNLTQDVNDAINTMMGGPVAGGLSFLADMVLRTSFFFQKGRVFEVTDWKEPAWAGEFTIKIKGAGSKHEKGEKGGPDQDHAWSMDRYIEGKMHTPDWEEENEETKQYASDGRHKLEVDGDSRYFRLKDSSSSRTKNSNNRYEANGPLQIQPPGHNQLALYSRAEPSGHAELTFTGNKMILDLQPFFGAKCLVSRSESARGRSSNRSGPEYLSLLDGVSPGSFTIIEDWDGKSDSFEGSKTFDTYSGSLPYVPSFDVTVTIEYRLWKNTPPPKNKGAP